MGVEYKRLPPFRGIVINYAYETVRISIEDVDEFFRKVNVLSGEVLSIYAADEVTGIKVRLK